MTSSRFRPAPLPSTLAVALAFFAVPQALALNCTNANMAASNPDSAYTDNGDGTVTDNRSGLMWDQCPWGYSGSACTPPGSPATYTWSAALGVAVTANAMNSGVGYKNYNDWRLPTILELRGLVEECRTNPSINDTLFPNTPGSSFWSGSPYAYGSDGAWFVSFDVGHAGSGYRHNTVYVRLVRVGQSFDTFDKQADYTPAPLGDYTAATGVAAGNTVTAADSKTLTGLTTFTGIKIAGDGSPEYRVNGGGWTADPGAVKNGDVIEVRLTAAATASTTRTATLTVGGMQGSFAVTTATVPDAPTGASAVAGDGQATVSWTAPSADGGSAITGYTVTGNPGGSCVPSPATATSCTVTGLTDGTAYTFTVTATNAIGTGSASTASSAVTPQAASGGGGAGGGGGGGATLPTGGGSANVDGTGGTIAVNNNGEEGSTIAMGSGSQVNVVLPGQGGIGVASTGGTTLKVENTQVDGKAVQVLAVTRGSATATASQAGQTLVSAGGLTLVSGQAGSQGSASVDAQGGVTLQVAPGDQVIVNPGVTHTNARVNLGEGGSVQIQSGGDSIGITPAAGGATLAFNTVDVNGIPTPVPTVVSGEVQVSVPATCAAMLSVNTTAITAGQGNSQAQADQGNGLVTVTLTAGQGLVGGCPAANRMAQDPALIYTGESAEFNPDGTLQRIRLGSLGQDQGWTGDPLNLALPERASGQRVPKLAGDAARLGSDLETAVVQTLADATGLPFSGSQDQETGALRLSAGGLNVVGSPAGDVKVASGPGLAVTPGGDLFVNTGGLQTHIVPSLLDFPGFAGEQVAEGALAVSQRTDGTILLADRYANLSILRPDWAYQPGGTPGRGAAETPITYTDRQGNRQILYPAFADLGQLVAVFAAIDPALQVQVVGGVVWADFLGQTYLLAPDYEVVPTPPAHQQEAWWLDGAKVYIRYPAFGFGGRTDYCQGFGLSMP